MSGGSLNKDKFLRVNPFKISSEMNMIESVLLVMQITNLDLDDFNLISILLGVILFIIILVYIGITSGKEDSE